MKNALFIGNALFGMLWCLCHGEFMGALLGLWLVGVLIWSMMLEKQLFDALDNWGRAIDDAKTMWEWYTRVMR